MQIFPLNSSAAETQVQGTKLYTAVVSSCHYSDEVKRSGLLSQTAAGLDSVPIQSTCRSMAFFFATRQNNLKEGTLEKEA